MGVCKEYGYFVDVARANLRDYAMGEDVDVVAFGAIRRGLGRAFMALEDEIRVDRQEEYDSLMKDVEAVERSVLR